MLIITERSSIYIMFILKIFLMVKKELKNLKL